MFGGSHKAIHMLFFVSSALDNNVVSAKALYEKVKEEKMVPDELFLKRLAGLLKNSGESLSFTEPPVGIDFSNHSLFQPLIYYLG